MIILGLDPGETTGYCIVEVYDDKKEGYVLEMGHIKYENLAEFLFKFKSDYVRFNTQLVVEDYKIRAGKAAGGYQHQWATPIAIKILGMLEGIGFKYKLQQPAIKPVAAGWTGLPYEKNKKGQHHYDAALHVGYYLIKERKFPPRCLKIDSTMILNI